jgi:predicted nucleic acid-binding protein
VTSGLDTSVVVRLLTGEPEAQYEAARRRLAVAQARGETVLVPDLVVAEAFHVLRHHYGIPEPAVRQRMRDLLRSGLVEPDPPGVEAVLDEVVEPGFVDRLIHLRCRERQAPLLTFDRAQARLPGAELLG